MCRTYVFNKLLPQPSELITVTLPRPLGVVFEYDQRFKRAVVVDTVEGSAAAQKQKVAGLNPRLAKETVQTGVIRMGAEHDIRGAPLGEGQRGNRRRQLYLSLPQRRGAG
jgi:hypothetical protein